MRKFLRVAILFLWSSLAVAQDFPKAEIFGGYQYSRQNSSNLNGWNASLTGNFNHAAWTPKSHRDWRCAWGSSNLMSFHASGASSNIFRYSGGIVFRP